MRKLLSLSAALGALLMLASGSVLAQGHGHGNGKGNDRHEQHDGDRGHGQDRGQDQREAYRGPGRGHYKSWHDRGRHEGWYKRGGYLPVEYRTRYVVTDWRQDRLRPPPRGYHWVRSDNGDFLLVAITTGIIMDLILNQ